MASTSIHIANTKIAIENGIIPGNFNTERTTWTFPTISYRGSRGKIHMWTISVSLERDGKTVAIKDKMLDQPAYNLTSYRAITMVESLQEGGKIRDVVPTYTSSGKRIGTVAETNCYTQALRDALSKYNKQTKRIDTVTPADIVKHADIDASISADIATPTNCIRPPPMLVKRFGKKSGEVLFSASDYSSGITLQRKFNGVRYVVALCGLEETDNPQLIPYSRTGTIYPGQEHILREMAEMIKAMGLLDMEPYFDGELYLHGKSLNWISGQARKGDDSGILEYHIYDVFFPSDISIPSRDRQKYLDEFFAVQVEHSHIKRVKNFPIKSESEMIELSKQFVADGYEGAIARKDAAIYQYGYSNLHSSNLLKIKPIYDDEFKVVGFTQGIKGKDVGAIIWECEVHEDQVIDPDDTLFTVVPKDISLDDRKALFKRMNEIVKNADGKIMTRFERDIKGLPLTVEYSERSIKTGKPLQAKALAFRTYESGPDSDPIRMTF